MGSDPQSYLQYQEDSERRRFFKEFSKAFPYAVYPGSEKLDLGPKSIAVLCSSQVQAEELITAMWPGIGYWERIDD